MSEPHSIAPAVPAKPAKPGKPYLDFPLTAHPAGYWCKKIRGKVHYFGPWADPDGALAKYLEQRDALQAGRTPRPETADPTVKDVANAFLNHKKELLDAGELASITFDGYKSTADMLVKALGKTRLVADLDPADFAALRRRMARRWGPARLAREIQGVKSMFKLAIDNGLIDRLPRFGQGFKRPSAKVLRLQRAAQGPKLFTAEEIHRLMGAANVPLRAMILLGVNCGFGNSDVGNLPMTALDLEGGWLDFPRPKTGVRRRCPLWPETVAALQEALARRREPKDPSDNALLFLTQRGYSWRGGVDSLADKVGRLLRQLGINGRQGLGFYTLRHVFRTVADECRDQPAVDHIMGHSSNSMAAVYRERIADERLQAVTDHVHGWLFPPQVGSDNPQDETGTRDAV